MKLFYSDKKICCSFLFLLVLPLFFLASGCRKGPENPENEVLAKINDYELTVADFKQEADLTMGSTEIEHDFYSVKEGMLDGLILKKLFLQEAQKMDFDKEQAFMKEIERYWEQALLKLLIKRKMQEISSQIQINEKELTEEYDRRRFKFLAEVVFLRDKAAAEELSRSGDRFEEVKNKISKDILVDKKSDWFLSGDLTRKIENILYGLKEGQISSTYPTGNNWGVIKLFTKEEIEIPPFEEISEELRSSLRERKMDEAFETWFGGLFEKADIEVNKELLKKIELE